MIPDIVPAGKSIIWGLAKETEKYEDILRYPREDSRYVRKSFEKQGHNVISIEENNKTIS